MKDLRNECSRYGPSISEVEHLGGARWLTIIAPLSLSETEGWTLLHRLGLELRQENAEVFKK